MREIIKSVMIFIVSLFIILLLCSLITHAREGHTKLVLVLNSYHKGFFQTDNIVKGIESVWEQGKNDVELAIEYMDTKTIGYETQYKERLYELYKYKYGNQKFDLIISSDDNAFNFLREYHENLFPEVPIVFCGVNNLDASGLIDPDKFTGIIEFQSIKETIDLALRLHPETRQILFIVDNTPTGLYLWNQMRKLFKYYKNIRMIRIGDNLSMEQIEDRVNELSDDAIVLFGPLNRDKSGKYYSSEEAALRVSKASARPVYGYAVQVLPYGIVGGKLFGGFYHGRNTAEIAQRILKGEEVRNIPVDKTSSSRYMFDYNQMQRFNIRVSDLPEESIIINKPYSFYKENKDVILGIIAIIIFQLLIIIVLIVNTLKRRRVEEELAKHREHLEEEVKERTSDLEKRISEVEQLNRAMTNLMNDLQTSNENLELTTSRLGNANKELEAFAYSVSHDLRTPLRGIDGFSQALLEDYANKLDKDGKHYLERVRAGTQRMGQLIDDILNFSRIGRNKMKPKSLDLNKPARKISKELQQLDPERKVEFTIQEEIIVNGDAHLLQIVLENLLGNAWKFTAGRSDAKIEFGMTVEKGKRVCYVKDNGVGFDMKYADKLFIPFHRLHHAEEYEGTGIGLANVQRIIHRHGGQIRVESAPNVGTTFYFTLPG